MIICGGCYRPKDGESKCPNCNRYLFKVTNVEYSIKQWEWWVESLRNCSHDFCPHEFNEDGSITRGRGFTGYTGNTNKEI